MRKRSHQLPGSRKAQSSLFRPAPLLLASTPTPLQPLSPFPPALASPSLLCSPNPLPSSTASLISMAIKGEVWWAVPCILSRSIIAPFSGDTGAACGTNLSLPISLQRPGKPLPQPSRPGDPELVSGALPALRGLQLGLSHGILHIGRVTPADLPRGQGSPHPEPSSLLPPHTIPLGRPSAPAPSIQYRASNLDWQLISYMIFYMFQCHSPKSSHPLPLPQSPKDCSIHQCLFCCLVHRVIVTIFLNSIYMH